MKKLLSPIAVLLLLVCAGIAQEGRGAPQPNPTGPLPFGTLKWRNIGPNRGGRSLACAGSAARPLEYYFGAVGGGLWKTTDGGDTWKAVTDGQLKSSSVGALAVSESNPDIVYIGMGETELRGNIMQGDGVYKSTDAGKTWKHMGLENTQAISRIRVSPTDPNVVFVAALGHPYGASEDRGVFKSTDGGQTWRKVLYKSDHAGAVDLAMDPKDPNVLFAAIWDANRTPWSLTSGGPDTALYKSTDGGEHWTDVTREAGLPKGIDGKIGVAISNTGSGGRRVYAIVENQDGGVYRTDDDGMSWTLVNNERKVRQRAFYYTRIYADPKDRDTLYVLNTALFRSTDGGKTFKNIREPHGDNHDLWIASNDPKRMINSNDGGGNVSTNGGETWTGQGFPTAQLYHVAVTKDIPYQVCGAQQDNSTLCVVSSNGGNFHNPGRPDGDWLYDVGGGESGYIAPSPKDPNIFYAGSQGALLTRYDRSTGHTRDIQVYPRFFSGQPASSLPERWQWTFPIVFSPEDPNVLYTSSQHLFKTTNDGQTWEKISPDLTRADPKTLGDSGGPITHDQNGPEIYATIFTIAPSKSDANTIWTGSDDGLVYLTRDGGKNWEKITPPDLPEFSRITLIEASAHNPAEAYLTAVRYQLDDRKPYVFRTTDFGRTWSKITDGFPQDDFVRAVREDTKRSGLLYAGTEHGVYVSFDDGAHWQSMQLNLPDTQVPDLVVQGDDLVIATHGRSFYVLDDIAPLRQFKPEIAQEPLHLYTPGVAVRSLSRGVVDYYLKDAADKVTVDILDAQGKVVRSFTGTPDDDKKKPAQDEESEFRRPRVQPPTRKAGLNRFYWDLRYPGAKTFEGMILWGAQAETGPMAVPGDYQVRITANGQTQTQPLKVEMDPRLKGVTVADLQKQFDLAMQIQDKVSEANDMVIRIRDFKKQIADRKSKVEATAFQKAADDLTAKLSTIEETVYQVRNRSGQDPLNFPIKLNNLLAALQRSVMTGDYPPTDAAYGVFKEESQELAKVQAQMQQVESTDLVAFNKMVAKQKLAAIAPSTGTAAAK